MCRSASAPRSAVPAALLPAAEQAPALPGPHPQHWRQQRQRRRHRSPQQTAEGLPFSPGRPGFCLHSGCLPDISPPAGQDPSLQTPLLSGLSGRCCRSASPKRGARSAHCRHSTRPRHSQPAHTPASPSAWMHPRTRCPALWAHSQHGRKLPACAPVHQWAGRTLHTLHGSFYRSF